jgi:hypothetical protein
MADITPYLKGQSFDPEMLHVMGLAFDKARRHLHDTGQPAVIQELIAERIIFRARTGIRDPDKLARGALEDLGVPPKT